MKKAASYLLAILGVFVSAGLLARLWLTRPEIFPAFPKPLAEYLVTLYGAQNAEEIADLELVVALCLSLVIVSGLTLFAYYIWHRTKHIR